jgi:hypothetical protein
LWIVLCKIVQVGDERPMMPVVMDFHGLGIDVRLERIGRIGQWIELGTDGRRSRALRKGDPG